jgi:hypothetical protein
MSSAFAISGLIVLVIAVTAAAAASLAANRVPHPLTIGYAAAAAMLVIAGPPLNRYFGRLMLSNARQHITDAPGPRSPWRCAPAIPAITPLITQGAPTTGTA